MLMESGISVAPHECLHAPDAKHMPPPSANVCCVRHAELLPSIVEKHANDDNNNNNNDSNNDNDDSANDNSANSDGDNEGDNDNNGNGDGDNNNDNDNNDNDGNDDDDDSSTESSESEDHGEEHEAKAKNSENMAGPSKASRSGSRNADNAHITEEAPTKGEGGTAPSG